MSSLQDGNVRSQQMIALCFISQT